MIIIDPTEFIDYTHEELLDLYYHYLDYATSDENCVDRAYAEFIETLLEQGE